MGIILLVTGILGGGGSSKGSSKCSSKVYIKYIPKHQSYLLRCFSYIFLVQISSKKVFGCLGYTNICLVLLSIEVPIWPEFQQLVWLCLKMRGNTDIFGDLSLTWNYMLSWSGGIIPRYKFGFKGLEQWKNLGWLGYIRDYTTQVYRDF